VAQGSKDVLLENQERRYVRESMSILGGKGGYEKEHERWKKNTVGEKRAILCVKRAPPIRGGLYWEDTGSQKARRKKSTDSLRA